MKKTVLALATLAAVSGTAFAQSSVTLYGVVDASLESVKGTKSTTRLTSDNYNSSRLGFRGVEDLGGGLKGKFLLESGLAVDTGTANTTRFWSRSAWLGLEGGFGELRLGRQDSSIGAIAGNTNILGAQDYDDLKFASTFAGDTYRRVDNAITYILPKFVDGLSIQAQYSLAAGTSSAVGNELPDDDTGKAFGLSVQYAAGPFGAGFGYINANQTDDFKDEGWLLYGSYDFGAAKLTGYYNVDDRESLDANANYDKRDVLGIKVNVPITNEFSLSAGVSKVSNVNFVQDADATVFALKGVYNLSKRTALYGLITHVDNEDTSNIGVAKLAPGAGKTSHGIAVGVRHSF